MSDQHPFELEGPPSQPTPKAATSPISGLPGTSPLGPALAGLGGSAASSQVSDNGFDPKLVGYIILKRLWLVVAIVLLVPTGAWLYARRMPKEYSATASLVIDVVTPQYLGQQFRDVVDPHSGSWWSSREYMETQTLIIRSRFMAQAVAENLCAMQVINRATGARVTGLQLVFQDTPINCAVQTQIQAAAPIIQKMVSLVVSRDSRVVQLSALGGDPEAVALVANTYVETYVTRTLKQRVEASGDAAGWLGGEYSALQQKLSAAEEELVKFKTDNNLVLVSLDDQQSDVARRQRRLSEEIDTIRLKIIALRPLREQYARITADDFENLTLPVADNEVIRNLKKQYIDYLHKKVEIAGKYLDKHPQVVAQEAGLATIREELRKEIKQVIKTAQVEYDMLVQQETDLRKAYKEATAEVMGLQSKVVRYNQLRLNVDRLRRLTETVGGRETESGLASRLRTNNVHALDTAQVPTEPVGPNVRAAVLTALGLSLALAIALAFLLEFLDSTVKTQEDMERVLRMPFLGMIPHLPEEPMDAQQRPEKKDLFIARHPKSTVSECCRVIRTNLLFMSPDHPARTLLVTSAGPQEGKSMSSISLALSMAQSGSRVLLVDTDMRRPRLHKVFGLQSGGIGLTTVIANTVPALEAVRTTDYENLFLMPCGPMPPNPAELLQTDRFKQIVTELAGAFDKVIFDSPPIGAVTDALVLSQVTDGVILVAKSHKTSRDMLRRAHRQLQDLNAHMLGCVLNDLDLENRRKGYGYPYYYYYRSGYYRYGYGYYTSEAEDKAQKAQEKAAGGDAASDAAAVLVADQDGPADPAGKPGGKRRRGEGRSA